MTPRSGCGGRRVGLIAPWKSRWQCWLNRRQQAMIGYRKTENEVGQGDRTMRAGPFSVLFSIEPPFESVWQE